MSCQYFKTAKSGKAEVRSTERLPSEASDEVTDLPKVNRNEVKEEELPVFQDACVLKLYL